MATRLSPGVWRLSNGKTVNSPTDPEAKGKQPTNNQGGNKKPQGQQILKKNPTDTKSAVQGQFDANQAFAGQQEQYNRFNQQGPTGSQVWVKNPDGSSTLQSNLSGNQQGILQGQEALSQFGNSAALQGVQDAGLNKAFDPRDAKFQEQQQYFTDAAFKELTRGWDQEKAKDKTNLEQSLAEKGIPTIPGHSEAYDTATKDFNTFWGDRDAQAKNQAISQGLSMWGDVANTAAGINNQTLGQAQNLSGLGSGLVAPQFAAPSQINFQTPDVAGTAQGFGQLANQRAALRPQGGGGRPQGGGQPAAPASPFYSTPQGGSFNG